MEGGDYPRAIGYGTGLILARSCHAVLNWRGRRACHGGADARRVVDTGTEAGDHVIRPLQSIARSHEVYIHWRAPAATVAQEYWDGGQLSIPPNSLAYCKRRRWCSRHGREYLPWTQVKTSPQSTLGQSTPSSTSDYTEEGQDASGQTLPFWILTDRDTPSLRMFEMAGVFNASSRRCSLSCRTPVCCTIVMSDLGYSNSGLQRKYVVRNGLREPLVQDSTVGAVMHKSGGRRSCSHSPPPIHTAASTGGRSTST
jgi:hypothetical protein